MKAELDALRRAVDEATEQVIAAECDLEQARGVEYEATSKRQDAEAKRNTAAAKLVEARAALDARLGLVSPPGPLPALPPRKPNVRPLLDIEEVEDDDDPVR